MRRRINENYHYLLTFLLILCALINVAGSSYAEELNNVQKLIKVRDQIVDENGANFAIPCHELGVHYNQGFPAWIVGADNTSGKMTSNEYKNSKFLSISYQTYEPGKKHYILPVYYTDIQKLKAQYGKIAPPDEELEGEFIGYISFKVKKVDEPYHKEKHKLVVSNRDDHKFNGYNSVYPIKDYLNVPDTSQIYYGSDVIPYIRQETVFTEICSNPHFWEAKGNYRDLYDNEIKEYRDLNDIGKLIYPEPHIIDRFGKVVSRFPEPEFNYKEDEIPVALGYWMHYGDEQASFINKMNVTEGVVILISSLTPGVGTIMDIKNAIDCRTQGEDGCWKQYAALASSAASDLGWFLKIGKGAKFLAERIPKISKLPPNHLIYTSVAVDTTLAGVYLYNEEYLSAVGSMLSAGGQVALVRYIDGKIKFANLGEAGPKCKTIPEAETKVTTVESNVHEYTKCKNQRPRGPPVDELDEIAIDPSLIADKFEGPISHEVNLTIEQYKKRYGENYPLNEDGTVAPLGGPIIMAEDGQIIWSISSPNNDSCNHLPLLRNGSHNLLLQRLQKENKLPSGWDQVKIRSVDVSNKSVGGVWLLYEKANGEQVLVTRPFAGNINRRYFRGIDPSGVDGYEINGGKAPLEEFQKMSEAFENAIRAKGFSGQIQPIWGREAPVLE